MTYRRCEDADGRHTARRLCCAKHSVEIVIDVTAGQSPDQRGSLATTPSGLDNRRFCLLVNVCPLVIELSVGVPVGLSAERPLTSDPVSVKRQRVGDHGTIRPACMSDCVSDITNQSSNCTTVQLSVTACVTAAATATVAAAAVAVIELMPAGADDAADYAAKLDR